MNLKRWEVPSADIKDWDDLDLHLFINQYEKERIKIPQFPHKGFNIYVTFWRVKYKQAKRELKIRKIFNIIHSK